jgi:hypothetical protein
MKFLDRGMRQAVGVLALLWVVPASAQENLYGNKTPAQIFASDCAICHKSPQGLSKAGGPLGLGLEGFLREHYTASRESAAALAKYVQSMDSGPAAPEKNAKRGAAKPAAKKPGDGKDGKAAGGKPSGEPKGDTKGDVKTEAKPEPKAEPKAEAKPESKPAEAAKPEKSE